MEIKTMTRYSHLLRAAILAVGVLLVMVPVVGAYDGEVDDQVGIEGPTTADCPEPVEIKARVFDKEGNPLAGREVIWSTGETGTTDADGYVNLTLVVSGDITVKATSGESSAELTITCERGEVDGAVGGAVGLPRTDTEAPASFPAVPILSALAVLGLVLTARRKFAPARG